jgi:hypothetical protein
MGEPIACTINLYGVQGDPPNLVEAFAGAMFDADYYRTVAGWRIWGYGNYGLQDNEIRDLLDRCVANKIPFVAEDEAKYEWLGSRIVFDGERMDEFNCAGGQVVLTESQYNDMTADQITEYFKRSSPENLPENLPKDTDD